MDKKCCRNCHFLGIYRCIEENGQMKDGSHSSLTLKLRDRIKNKEFSPKDLNEDQLFSCHKKVWDAGARTLSDKNFYEIVNKERNEDNCFYWKHSPGMLYEAAYELWKLHKENKNLKDTMRLTVLGLILSALALLINGLAAL